MAKKRFSAQVADFVKESDARMNAVVLDAVSETINIAQIPVAKGGRMRVDTGFLRASGQVSFDTLPTGPQRGAKGKDGKLTYQTDENYMVKLAGFKLGQKIYFGWSAQYAEVRNAYDGFLDNAVQQWSDTVNKSVAKLAKRLGI